MILSGIEVAITNTVEAFKLRVAGARRCVSEQGWFKFKVGWVWDGSRGDEEVGLRNLVYF